MPLWVECLLRILLAVGLGFIMGMERQLRLKVAGIRTHAVVCAGACIFMLISKYGFTDSANFDASRIASQVVSGISFIGAGMIMHRQQAVHGLTSAAGIWLTAAVGMASGAGMYIIASGATLIILLVQMFMHLPMKLFKDRHSNRVIVVFEDNVNIDAVKKIFDIKKFAQLRCNREEEILVCTAEFYTSAVVDDEFVGTALRENIFIKSIQILESD